MRQVRHPLVEQDVAGIFEHVLAATEGDLDAAQRRLDELLAAIAADPSFGMRLGPAPPGSLVRHGGRGRRLTVVSRPDLDRRLPSVDEPHDLVRARRRPGIEPPRGERAQGSPGLRRKGVDEWREIGL